MTTMFKTMADAVKALGGEGNVVKILNAYQKNQGARKEYQATRQALLDFAKAQLDAGKITLAGGAVTEASAAKK